MSWGFYALISARKYERVGGLLKKYYIITYGVLIYGTEENENNIFHIH